MNEETRKRLGTLCLVIATFLNPFGYDILVYRLTLLTKDYWTTMHILYVLAGLFFTLFFVFYRKNPFRVLLVKINNITEKLKSKRNGKNI
jgi:hypothetical protein